MGLGVRGRCQVNLFKLLSLLFLVLFAYPFGLAIFGNAKPLTEEMVAENRIQEEDSDQSKGDARSQNPMTEAYEKKFKKNSILYIMIILFLVFPYQIGREVLSPNGRFLLYVIFVIFLLCADAAMQK